MRALVALILLLTPVIGGVSAASAQTDPPEWTGTTGVTGDILDGSVHAPYLSDVLCTIGSLNIENDSVSTNVGEGQFYPAGQRGTTFEAFIKCNYYIPLATGRPAFLQFPFRGENSHYINGFCGAITPEAEAWVQIHAIQACGTGVDQMTLLDHEIIDDDPGVLMSGRMSLFARMSHTDVGHGVCRNPTSGGLYITLSNHEPDCDEWVFDLDVLYDLFDRTLSYARLYDDQGVYAGKEDIHMDGWDFSVFGIDDLTPPRSHDSFPDLPEDDGDLDPNNSCTITAATITDSQTNTLVSDPLNGLVPEGFLFRDDRAYDFSMTIETDAPDADVWVVYDGLIIDTDVGPTGTYSWSHTYQREFPYYPIVMSCRSPGAIGLDSAWMVETGENHDSYYYGGFDDPDWLGTLGDCFDAVTPGGGSWLDWLGDATAALNPGSWVASASCVLQWGFIPQTPGFYWVDRLRSDLSISPLRFLTEAAVLPFEIAQDLDDGDTNQCTGPSFTFPPTGTVVTPFDACDSNGVGQLASVVSVGLSASIYLSGAFLCVRLIAGGFGATLPTTGSDV